MKFDTLSHTVRAGLDAALGDVDCAPLLAHLNHAAAEILNVQKEALGIFEKFVKETAMPPGSTCPGWNSILRSHWR